MKELHGQLVFEEGDELFVRLPEFPGKTARIQAVKATRDNYYCYDCCFNSRCSKYPGNSPLAWNCYSTIFEIKEFIKTEGREK